MQEIAIHLTPIEVGEFLLILVKNKRFMYELLKLNEVIE